MHLIRDHCFIESSLPYRLGPTEVIHFVELQPRVDYTPKEVEYTTREEWTFLTSLSLIPRDLSTFKEFMPGVYGRINEDKIELVNANSHGVEIPVTPSMVYIFRGKDCMVQPRMNLKRDKLSMWSNEEALKSFCDQRTYVTMIRFWIIHSQNREFLRPFFYTSNGFLTPHRRF